MYDKMLQFVKDSLAENDVAATQLGSRYPFRKRSEHTKRVFMWAKRLIDDAQLEKPVNREAILISAIFHDSGYADCLNKSEHAISSAILCEKYLRENKYSDDFKDLVVYLVQNHSKKKLMTEEDTPLELILLMEADLLDETGALSILWDCMAESRQQEQSFENTYNRILKYTYKSLNVNPMVTPKAKVFWESKQKLMQEFIKHLSFDLGIEEGMHIKSSLKQAYNNHAQEREKNEMKEWKVKPRQTFLALLEKEKKKTLLEIGAGHGRDSKFFKDNDLDVVAVDLSDEMVKLCREKDIEAYELDFYNLSGMNRRFDAVWAMNCLLHVEKSRLSQVLNEISLVLNTSGLFFMGVYGGFDEEGIWEDDIYSPKRFFSFYTDDSILNAVKIYFDMVSFEKIDTGGKYYFQSMILRKKAEVSYEPGE